MLTFIMFVCLLCLRSVESQDVKLTITGPDFLVTDGARNLTLTCQADISPGDQIVWFTPGTETHRCQTGTPDNVCTFTPRLEDDNHNVTCIVIDSQVLISAQALYRVNLQYPPPSYPTLTTDPPKVQRLKQGDIITCSVSGGKPRVSSVTLYCQNPNHADREDDVSDDGHSVSSSITVDTSQATEVSMNCTCYANWRPEPGLYSYRTTLRFQLEQIAKVTTFTINNTTELTVTEDSNTSVMFDCRATGSPKPTVRLYRQGSNSVLAQNTGSSVVQFFKGLARCEDTGNYVCEADNGYPDPDKRSVRLVVNCGPRLDIPFLLNNTSPKELTSQGLTFGLVARPTPDVTVIRYLGRTTLLDNTTVPANMFQTQCRRDALSEHAVICEIKPVAVPTEYIGVYSMSLSNGLGTFTFRFEVKSPVSGPSPAEDNLSSPAVIGTVSVAVTAVVVAVVIVAVVMWKYRNSQQQQRGEEQPPNPAPAAQEGTHLSHQHVETGNPYDVLQHGQEDDGRTYTELMTSSTTEDGNYLHPVNRKKNSHWSHQRGRGSQTQRHFGGKARPQYRRT